MTKSKRKRFVIMDSNFMLSTQTEFITRDGHKQATEVLSIKNGSKKAKGMLKKEASELAYDKQVQKSLDLDNQNDYINAYKDLVSLGFNKPYQKFIDIHVCKSSKRIKEKEITKTKKLLLKVRAI